MDSKEVWILAIVAAFAIFVIFKAGLAGSVVVDDPCLEVGIENGQVFYDFTRMNLYAAQGHQCFVTRAYQSAGCCIPPSE